jgi:hypothetical protein
MPTGVQYDCSRCSHPGNDRAGRRRDGVEEVGERAREIEGAHVDRAGPIVPHLDEHIVPRRDTLVET